MSSRLLRPIRLASAARERLARADRVTLAALLVAGVAGLLTFAIAATVFAYHSSNHDEAVYLTQAAMLLSGQLELHAGSLADAFHPWFFVEDGGRLYPKYTPVPAAMYAVSMGILGEPRVTLAVVAAGNAALVYLLGSMVADRRVGVAAAVLFAASPLALVTGSTFLPYAPTTFLNLCFAVAYLRSVRDGSLPAAGVAGVAVGLAFFARPYTAVLFAAPFICHALVRVASSLRASGLRSVRSSGVPLSVPGPVRRHGLTALLGTAFVGLTLAYNLRLTGSPLTFPYQAFAPMDGPGFGERRILGHSADYTLGLALESNAYALWFLATRWVTAGPIGSALALAGGALAVRRWRRGERVSTGGREGAVDADAGFERTAGLLLAGVAGSVVVGNLFFWGTHNLLATLSDPTDGLVAGFGPFYHFDLLVPFSVFGGVALLAGWRALPRLRARLSAVVSPDRARVVVVVAVAVVLLAGGVAAAAVLATPLDRNAANAEKYEAAYEPVESTSLEDALVLVPTPYGEWQNHPFQTLRNDPGFDGEVVYALDRDPGEDFAVLDAYPNRTAYRYAYRGEWTPNPDRHVAPKLEPIDVRRGATLSAETTVGTPERVERARVRLTVDGEPTGRASYVVEDPGDPIAVDWSIDADGARLAGDPGTAVPIEVEEGGNGGTDGAGDGNGTEVEADTVVLTVTLVDPAGSTFTYRQEATVRTDGDRVEVVWPPERSVCPLVIECGNEGTYLPDDPDAHPDWVVFGTDVEADEA
ncbi:Dolichyl-phosphate-mannose-protein mannosyltransferase [Halorubrum aquaticum]|uniref:Dolichyl-phosphate-mannose-protein mannosyltransferase n=1 Tax=Halorubrum aquaticum TaxID=387340 RepID=A0A1I3CFA9_9EURY|nr:glycosyltransferase family 39 protein [Halorubrum aquaticum]SFH73220.1 Dolichyl-phosphate-mannose-protein mannosyltransferase [Halorubrum aquaticum]